MTPWMTTSVVEVRHPRFKERGSALCHSHVCTLQTHKHRLYGVNVAAQASLQLHVLSTGQDGDPHPKELSRRSGYHLNLLC